MLEIDFENGVPIRAGDQFGLGRVAVENTPARSASKGALLALRARFQTPPSAVVSPVLLNLTGPSFRISRQKRFNRYISARPQVDNS
jgi:hypothetical protein